MISDFNILTIKSLLHIRPGPRFTLLLIRKQIVRHFRLPVHGTLMLLHPLPEKRHQWPHISHGPHNLPLDGIREPHHKREICHDKIPLDRRDILINQARQTGKLWIRKLKPLPENQRTNHIWHTVCQLRFGIEGSLFRVANRLTNALHFRDDCVLEPIFSHAQIA